MRCTACGHVHTQGYWTPDGLTEIFATTLQSQIVSGNFDQKRQVWNPVVQNALRFCGRYDTVIQCSPIWVDVGCGDGALVMTAAEYGFHSVGIDAREQTATALKTAGYNAFHEDFMNIRFNKPVRVLSMMDILEHMPYPGKALQHAHTLLQEEGLLIISVPNMDSSSWKMMDAAHKNPYWIELEHHHNFTRVRLQALLAENGFSVVDYNIPFRYKAQMEMYARKESMP